jgi:FkbM family methyltransferase
MAQTSFLSNILTGAGKRLGRLSKNPYSKINFSWFKIKALKHSPQHKLRTIPFLEAQLTFIKRDDFLHSLEEIFIDDIYKLDLGKSPTIIDCGANIGLSVIYLKRRFPDATIIAFEPDEANFDLLEKNIRHFGFSNITLRKEAIWTADTTLNFSTLGTLGSKIEEGTHEHSTVVKATRLKTLLRQPVAFLKLDIEGAEYEVLMDTGNDLVNAGKIFIEYHGTFEQNAELTRIFELLTRLGFHYYIREAAPVHPTPFIAGKADPFDLQLNIFCFKK